MSRRYLALLLLLFSLISPGSFADEAQIKNVSTVLDDAHAAASAADYVRYFKHYADNAVFFGTDINERWPLDVFKRYAKARFDKGNGWTYESIERNVYFSENKRTAWFDEILFNQKYGKSRATGVLLKQGGEWKISQYHLTIPIPNDLAYDFVEQILEYEKQQ